MLIELDLAGSPEQIGRQHGDQVAWARPAIIDAVAAFQTGSEPVDRATVAQLSDYLHTAAGPTWSAYRATSEALGLDWPLMAAYALRTFLAEAGPVEGCTVFADSRSINGTVLAKTRDYLIEHANIQTIARVRPDDGFDYLSIGSAASPGVFGSGVNEHGVAVADTHVPTSDLAVGLPRYVLMQQILEGSRNCAEAIEYLSSVDHMGGGTLTVADALGNLAACESTPGTPRIRFGQSDYLVATNHFEPQPPRALTHETAAARESSTMRRTYVEQTLASRVLDTSLSVEQILASHDGPASVCRHAGFPGGSKTILATIYQPKRRHLKVSVGEPCRPHWQHFDLFAQHPSPER